MKRIVPLVLLLLILTMPLSSFARKGKPHKPAKVSPMGKLDAKPTLKPMDSQTLVNYGKRPAFFDTNDLSKTPFLSAKSAVLMDADTGQILWEKNADEPRAPASTTKILTGLLFAEHTKPTDIVTCLDPTVTKIEESSLHIKPWEKITAQNLLYGLMLRSANDGAVVVAEHVAGNVPKFADLMNKRAKEIGATHSNFVNPNGLFNPYHYTTARDLGKIACVALQNPRFADAVRIPRRKISRSKETRDVIVMSKAHGFYKSFPGADGVKTGYVRESGNCFVGSATRDGRRLLGVIMGARSNASGEMMPLLSWGFRRFPSLPVIKKGESAGTVVIPNGEPATISVVAAKNLHVTMDSLSGYSDLQAAGVTTKIVVNPSINAPIRRGQEIGHLSAKWQNNEICRVPLLAAQDAVVAPVAQAMQTAGRGFAHGWYWAVGITAILLVGWGIGQNARQIGYFFGIVREAKIATGRQQINGTTSAKSVGRRGNRLTTPLGTADRAGTNPSGRTDSDPTGDTGRSLQPDNNG